MKMNGLFKNSLWNLAYKVFNILIPLLTSAYASRILLPRGIGAVASAQNIASYFVLGSSLGISVYGVRVIAQNRNDKHDLNKNFSELFFINCISTVIFLVIYLLILRFNLITFNDNVLLLVAGTPILMNFFNFDWFFQGIEKYKYISIRSFFTKTLSLVLTVLLLKDSSDVLMYLGIIVTANSLTAFINLASIKNEVRITFEQLLLIRHVKSMLYLFGIAIAIELYTMLDITMLTFWSGEVSVGLYSNSSKIVKSIIMLLTSISVVALPRFSSYFKDFNFDKIENLASQITTIIFFFVIPATFGLYLLADNVLYILYSDAFLPAVSTLKILTLLIMPITFSTFMSSHLLVAMSKEKYILFAVFSGAVMNVCLNIILIPKFNHEGAAVASVISEYVVFFILIFIVRKNISLKININNLTKSFVASLIMFVFLLYLKTSINNNYIFLISGVLGGLLIYIVLGKLMNNVVVILIKEEALKVLGLSRLSEK